MPAAIAATALLILVFVLAGGIIPAAHSAAQEPDSREAYSRSSPDWLRAVGKLQVPTIKIREGQRRHHLEDCSATLVSGPDRVRADTIITAWHCLEYYSDLSQRITFTLFPDSVDPIASEVYRLADGGGIYADWAILRLYQPIPAARVDPLKIHPSRADKHANIAMAGYSRDAGLSRHGQLLTYDPGCMITLQDRNSSKSDCRAHRGASGGAVV